MTTPDRYAPIRRHARRRLAALARAAALGGVALAVLAPGAASQTDRRADGVRPDARPGDHLRRTLDRPVRAATPAAARVLGGSPTSRSATFPVFQSPQDNPFGLTDVGSSSKPSIGDLDGDGDLDVLSGEFGDDFLYFENTAGAGATPAFAAAQTNPFGLAGPGFGIAGLSMVDLDGDGDLDVLAGTNGNFVYYENTAGAGAMPAFAAAQTNPFGLSDIGFDSTPSVTDLDGDGDLDVLAGESDGGFFYFENTAGSGATPAFAAPQTNPFGLANVGSRRSAPAAGDLDGDGDLDVLSGEEFGSFIYFENVAGPAATPAFAPARVNPFGLTSVVSNSTPAVGDLDNDGDLDVLSGDILGEFVYFRSNAPSAPVPVSALLPGGEGWRMLSAPADGATVDALLGTTHTQGFPGADGAGGEPTVFFYDEPLSGAAETGYRTPTDQSETIPLGRGVFAYLFEDDDITQSGIQGGFPKTLSVGGERPRVSFYWSRDGVFGGTLTYTDTGAPDDDGWNLLGNPFGSWFDWDAVELSDVNAPVYVYDAGIASYRTHSQSVPSAGSLPGGIVGPFQGF